MSYDLYLNRSADVTLEEFHDYFAKLPHCTCEGEQAIYQNEETGVYFVLDRAANPPDEEPACKVAVNLNYFRPHFFGLEAAPVLRKVVEHFQFDIHDPQNSGMGDGPFSEAGFLRGWNAGNAFGYRAILKSDPPPSDVWSRPTAELEAIWRWNHERAAVQQTLGDSIFVPKIFWMILDGALNSAAVWPDGIAALIPAVDLYYIGRDELAPRRFFRKTEDTCLTPRHKLEAALGPFTTTKHPLPSMLFEHEDPPMPVRAFVQGLSPAKVQGTGIPMDQVLNRELVEESQSR